jgi:hypothetical protein
MNHEHEGFDLIPLFPPVPKSHGSWFMVAAHLPTHVLVERTASIA